jgi:hypothetical protein
METKKVLKISLLVIILAGASFGGYKLYRAWKTSSSDPKKNNRRIVVKNENV